MSVWNWISPVVDLLELCLRVVHLCSPQVHWCSTPEHWKGWALCYQTGSTPLHQEGSTLWDQKGSGSCLWCLRCWALWLLAGFGNWCSASRLPIWQEGWVSQRWFNSDKKRFDQSPTLPSRRRCPSEGKYREGAQYLAGSSLPPASKMFICCYIHGELSLCQVIYREKRAKNLKAS